MPVPKFSDLFSDVLRVLCDGRTLHSRDLITAVVTNLNLSDTERAETLSGGGNRARSRVHWALEFLCQSGAVQRPQRGYAQITDLGQKLLQEQPEGVTLTRLRQTDGFRDWKRRSKAKAAERLREYPDDTDTDSESDERTPTERIEAAVLEIESAVANQLLQRLRDEEPIFLERTVLRLLQAMGYGDSDDDFQHLGGSNDGGVDGVFRQDKLGLDQIYIQAKRYGSATIGRPDIQGFVGALTGKHATRGVFITTSDFSSGAKEFALNIKQFRIILIDGDELVRLMIQHKVGTNVSRTVDVVEIDENFFADE